MTYTSKKYTQFELFPGENTLNQPNVPKSSRVFKDLTLSQENIIVISIIFIVSMVLFFSLGVERGKRVVLKEGILKIVQPKKVVPLKEIAPKILIKHEVKPTRGDTKGLADKREVLEIQLDKNLRYTIQVASFKQIGSAKEEAKTLETKGHETFVVPKGSYSIVCVGRFAGRSDAQQYAKKLKNRYGDYLIRRL